MPKVTKHKNVEESKHTMQYWGRVGSIVEFILNNTEYYKRNKYQALVNWVKNEYNVQERQAKRYITDAKAEIKDVISSRREQVVEFTVVQYKKILRECFTSASGREKHRYLKLALETLKDQNELLNLYPEKSVKQDNVNYDVDMNKFTEKGLERLKRGDDPREIMLDPDSVRLADE